MKAVILNSNYCDSYIKFTWNGHYNNSVVLVAAEQLQ